MCCKCQEIQEKTHLHLEHKSATICGPGGKMPESKWELGNLYNDMSKSRADNHHLGLETRFCQCLRISRWRDKNSSLGGVSMPPVCSATSWMSWTSRKVPAHPPPAEWPGMENTEKWTPTLPTLSPRTGSRQLRVHGIFIKDMSLDAYEEFFFLIFCLNLAFVVQKWNNSFWQVALNWGLNHTVRASVDPIKYPEICTWHLVCWIPAEKWRLWCGLPVQAGRLAVHTNVHESTQRVMFRH